MLGLRAGRRIGETPFRTVGISVAIATFAVLSLAVTLSALFAAARASIWQGMLLPTLVFAVGLVIGSALGRVRSEATVQGGPAALIRSLSARLGPEQRTIALTAARGGAASA